MGFRLSKSIRLGGGARLNISRRGLGMSVGTKGFRLGTGPRGTRTTVGIPGTGISYSATSKSHSPRTRTANGSGVGIGLILLIGLAVACWPIALTLAILLAVIMLVSRQSGKSQEATRLAAEKSEEDRRLEADASRSRSVMQSLQDGYALESIASPTPLAATEICYQVVEAGLCLDQKGVLTGIDEGHLILTNKRLIYLGAQKNITTQIKGILSLSVVKGAGFEVRSQSRQRREVYVTHFPREFVCLLFCVFRKHGIALPVTIEAAMQMQNGFICDIPLEMPLSAESEQNDD